MTLRMRIIYNIYKMPLEKFLKQQKNRSNSSLHMVASQEKKYVKQLKMKLG